MWYNQVLHLIILMPYCSKEMQQLQNALLSGRFVMFEQYELGHHFYTDSYIDILNGPYTSDDLEKINNGFMSYIDDINTITNSKNHDALSLYEKLILAGYNSQHTTAIYRHHVEIPAINVFIELGAIIKEAGVGNNLNDLTQEQLSTILHLLPLYKKDLKMMLPAISDSLSGLDQKLGQLLIHKKLSMPWSARTLYDVLSTVELDKLNNIEISYLIGNIYAQLNKEKITAILIEQTPSLINVYNGIEKLLENIPNWDKLKNDLDILQTSDLVTDINHTVVMNILSTYDSTITNTSYPEL